MKFPYELSTDRQSLLSKEDQFIYTYEHSDCFSFTEREEGLKAYQKALLERQGYFFNEIEEDEEYNEMSEVEKTELAKKLANAEADTYVDELFEICKDFIDDEDGITNEEYESIKELVIEQLHNPEPLNEYGINILSAGAEGKDEFYWMKDMSWLGKLAASLLTGIFGSLVSLILAGKDKMAMKLLEKYMNRLVEKTDDGIHKKKSFFAKLFGKGEDYGDQSKSCFRVIQENFQSRIATDAMVLVKACGFLPDDLEGGISSLETNRFNRGGMQRFLNNIGYPIASLSTQTTLKDDNDK